MAIQVKHNFVSPVVDAGNPNEVGPSEWNDVHSLTMASGFIIGRASAGNGPAEELTLSSLISGSLSFRNKLINGDMSINQRFGGGIQSVPAGVVTYTLDRYIVACNGGALTVQRGSANTYYAQLNGGPGVTSWGFAQRIESLLTNDLVSASVTLSFTIWGTTAGAVTALARYSGATDNWASSTVIATSSPISYGTSAARYSFTFNAGSFANRGLQIEISGGSFTSGIIFIQDVQFEQGSLASPFERRAFPLELMMAQRYYETGVFNWQGAVSAASGYVWDVPFKVQKSRTPTLGFAGGVVSNFGASSATNISADKFSISANSTTAQANSFNILTWTANAELQ
jgi:hypothetical protein